MIFQLVTEEQTLLRSRSAEWDFTNPPHDYLEVEANMERLMMTLDGMGFSGIQMGFAYRVFAMRTPEGAKIYYNPKILIPTGECVYHEGCLSFPGLFLKISRAESILVEYQDSSGQLIKEELTGIAARCYQHELDHLDGICFTDKISRLTLDIARRKRAKSERKN